MPRKSKASKPELVGLVGVGLDNQDEHQRITRAEHMLLVGGSEDTHERMQDVAIQFSESLHDQGKRLQEVTLEEVVEMLHRAMER